MLTDLGTGCSSSSTCNTNINTGTDGKVNVEKKKFMVKKVKSDIETHPLKEVKETMPRCSSVVEDHGHRDLPAKHLEKTTKLFRVSRNKQ